MENSIVVNNISKVYKLYDRPQDRVKEIFSIRKKTYHKDYKALSDVSFSLKKGETLGIIGKNGAGKSTLLKLITGVATPTSGTIQVNGNISALLELGTGFNPEYNGYENIYLNGAMRGFTNEQMDEKMDEIVDFADIGYYINQPVKTYSSGMFARLAFSVMISFKPEILIVDEALSVGDVFFQQKCNTYMKEDMKDVTKILVTHDMNSIANMADRVIMLDKGKIIQEGEPLEVIENYLKMMHSSVYAVKSKKVDDKKGSKEKVKKLGKNIQKEYKDDLDWIDVKKEDLGGAQELVIKSVCVLVNGQAGAIVKPKDKVEIFYRFNSYKDVSDIVCGYTFKDKYGNSIFAENTTGEKIEVKDIEENSVYKVKIQFNWPEIKEGDYFLTLGIGEGKDEMVHVIQCWAHNIIHLEAMALKPMHGIINHNMDEFNIERIGETSDE